MKRAFLTYFYVFLSVLAFAQQDTSITLRILDPKICIDKAKYVLSFSYYFENRGSENGVVVDYYEPCFWENPTTVLDSMIGIILIIEDDSGNILRPIREMDTTQATNYKRFVTVDSLAFFKSYEQKNKHEYHFNTSVLRPKAVMTSFFTMKLNKRKCFEPGIFKFDYDRKYTVRLKYVADENILQYINKNLVKKGDRIYVGEILSNKVELCFK